MDPFKTILCATDFSAPARHAAARAFKLAGEVGASVTLLHVLNRGALDELRALLGMQAEAVEQRLIERARAELTDVAAGVGAALEVAADVYVATGAVLREVLDHADGTDADLLVLGARGESFMRHLLLGSTASDCCARPDAPMLVVKQAPHRPLSARADRRRFLARVAPRDPYGATSGAGCRPCPAACLRTALRE